MDLSQRQAELSRDEIDRRQEDHRRYVPAVERLWRHIMSGVRHLPTPADLRGAPRHDREVGGR